MAEPRRIRVLVGKPGLDGHDRGAKVIASVLRDAGMEVIYTGLRATPEAIVRAAIQEDVDVIGLSILSGAHETISERVVSLLRERNAHVPVVVGGVIPPADVARLKALGVAAVFGQEARLDDIVAEIRALAGMPATLPGAGQGAEGGTTGGFTSGREDRPTGESTNRITSAREDRPTGESTSTSAREGGPTGESTNRVTSGTAERSTERAVGEAAEQAMGGKR